ncbi:MMPL family transporter [Catellatospora citrea]|uniref:Membrane protein n=1 Tax=Catellatospora citrea TaxID=53366 RepID=A0A8J3P331_9ACTN|nr:MMPL family transporter [Catellatospora citrea]RKE09956.1 RND superfamily putative drug exporter [Catellatospora citrea]GIG01999.1 membrane protein [Catellatospora citrea]
MFAWWGRAVVRLRWLVLGIAAAVLVIGASWGGGVFGDLISGGFDDPGSASSRAHREITAQLGRQDVDILALYSSDSLTQDQPAFRDAVTAVATELSGRPEVASVVGAHTPGVPGRFTSTDGHATYLAIQLRDGDENSKLDDLAALRDDLVADGLHTEVGGLIPFLDDANTRINDDITKAELISLPILLVLLVFIFRGLVAAATPLFVGVLAVLGAFVAVRLLAQVTDVSVFAVNIITMLGLGMAIDYALFVVSRFREELAAGRSPADAVARTLATAGRTVLVSGLTVALALASLLIFPMDFLKSMAWGGMAAVLVAMLAALTALPALLAVLGPKINAWRVPLPKLFQARPAGEGGWARIARSVMNRPVLYALGVAAILALTATPFLRAQFGGFDERVLPAGTESRTVTERIAAEFPGGSAAPISVLVLGPGADTMLTRVQAVPNVSGAMIAAQQGDAALITASYPGEPADESAREVVRAIRGLPVPDGTQLLVGGRTAADLDQLDSLGGRLPWMLAMVAVSTFLLLFLAFGSVVLPLKAIVMNVISIGASFGVVVWIFQDGHLSDWLGFTVTGFLEPGNMVLMLAVLFGLATDYEVFLLSRVREEWDATGDNTQAVASGLQRTGGIITAAALLLMVVLGGFATGGTTTIKVLGVGMVVAVAIDAALVRAVLVPATMRLLGRWNWWAPGPLGLVYRRYGLKEA